MSGVAVMGSISADLTVFGTPLPRPGETVLAEAFSMVLGGKGANQAIGAARAGAEVFMIGAVGDDLFRELTLSALTAEAIDTSAVSVLDGHTGIAHIRVDTVTGQNDIAIVANANARVTADRAEAALRSLAGRVSVVLVQLETPVATVVRTAEVCRELGLTLVLDPAPALILADAVWRGVSVVTPNETEAEVLTGIPVSDRDSGTRAAQWFLDRGVETVVITRGEHGVLVARAAGVEEIASFTVNAVDTTAAGDAFAGTRGASLPRGEDWSAPVRRAVAAGALATTVRGASPSLPTAAQVEEFLSTQT